MKRQPHQELKVVHERKTNPARLTESDKRACEARRKVEHLLDNLRLERELSIYE